jgi:hypothetical protein
VAVQVATYRAEEARSPRGAIRVDARIALRLLADLLLLRRP